MSRSTSLLDLEELPSREDHIGRLLESLNSQPSANSTAAQSARPILPLSPQINAIPPPSNLVPRVKAFLSLIEASNDALRRQMETDPSCVDMEVLDGTEEAYIEMDLGLGVFEQRGLKQSNTSSSSASSSENSESEDSSSSDESSSSSSDSGFDAGSDGQRPVLSVTGQSTMPDIISLVRPTRPFPRRRQQKTGREPVKKPEIVEVLPTDSEEGHR